MAKIPDGDIDRIKRETDLAALVRSRGIELRKHGSGDLIGKCPFHQDNATPNFIVTPAKGLWHCMACGAAGNAIQFVERFDGVSFRHAFELLNEGRAVFTAPADAPVKKTSIARLEAPVKPDAEDAELIEQVVAYYHERLLVSPAALDYLKKRGLHDEDVLSRFRIGFADRTLGLRLPYGNRKDGAAIRTRLQKLGIIRQSGHEHFNGSIVLPIFTASGEVGEMYGRKITRKLNEGSFKHLYLPGPHAGIWNPEALDSPELILCEAPLDALTFYVHGFRNVTFIYGTEGFTDELFNAIMSRKIGRIRIAYDADDAGNRAADRDAARLMARGIECFRIRFPHGMDANDYAGKMPDAQKALQSAINAAEWLGGASPSHTPLSACEHAQAGAGAPSLLAAYLAANESAANEKTSDPPFVPFEPFVVEKSSPGLERRSDYHFLRLGSREYRVGGLDKNNSLEVMKIALRLAVHPQPITTDQAPRTADDVRFHLDSLDLTRDGDRRRFIERAAEETTLEKELIKRDLGKLLLLLEEAQTARLSAALTTDNRQQAAEIAPAERAEAMAFLTAPDLISLKFPP